MESLPDVYVTSDKLQPMFYQHVLEAFFYTAYSSQYYMLFFQYIRETILLNERQ